MTTHRNNKNNSVSQVSAGELVLSDMTVALKEITHIAAILVDQKRLSSASLLQLCSKRT